MASKITSRPVLQDYGRVYFRNGDQVAATHRCMDEKSWSVRVAGARFEMSTGARFLAGGNRKYDNLTYVATQAEAEALVMQVLSRQRKHVALDPMYRTGHR